MGRISIVKVALVTGSIWSLFVLIMGLAAAHLRSEIARKFIACTSIVYRGYGPTPAGCLRGMVWGFLDGALTGMILAWIYNMVAL